MSAKEDGPRKKGLWNLLEEKLEGLGRETWELVVGEGLD